MKIKHGDYLDAIKKLFVFEDKTSSVYEIEKGKYSKLTTAAITSTYKKLPDKISNNVNADEKKINENKKVVNRFFVNRRNSCLISLKDHKPHFLKNLKVC